MRVVLCIIATGKYTQFVQPLITSAQKHFFRGQKRLFIVFTDDAGFSAPLHTIVQFTPHRPWPGPTLYRYHTMLGALTHLRACDYCFYVDADMLFVDAVTEEICGPGLTAVQHPGYCGASLRRLPYERREQSRARVGWQGGRRYYAGGFQGGRIPEWIAAMAQMAEAIEDDSTRGVTATWHDESHWNHLLANTPPAIELPMTYCCPESVQRHGRRILALNKNHEEMRR